VLGRGGILALAILFVCCGLLVSSPEGYDCLKSVLGFPPAFRWIEFVSFCGIVFAALLFAGWGFAVEWLV